MLTPFVLCLIPKGTPHSPPDINALRGWLAKNARLYVNDGLTSMDGEHDSLIVAKVDFFELEEN